jgi:hypothetical protein
MHYKNGREAKAGDPVMVTTPGSRVAGILYDINAGSDTCNGRVAPMKPSDPYVNIKDCLHFDDVSAATIPDSRGKGTAPTAA